MAAVADPAVHRPFALTTKQREAVALIGSGPQHILLEGGSRSGKTFLAVRAIVVRALAAPYSRHLIARFRFIHAKASIIGDTFPKVMRQCFPGVGYELDQRDWKYTLPNGAEIWIAGLDDKERTEKILGMEFATIYLNEASQIPKGSRDIAVTRLAQVALIDIEKLAQRPLRHLMLYDCNPPSKGHWTFLVFHRKIDPETRAPLPDPGNYAYLQINPGDNQINLPAGYIDTLKGLSPRLQRRFLLGEYADENPNALYSEADIDKWRHEGELPQMVRVVVAVDPSGAGDEDNADNDEIGIIVAGLGIDGNAYVLEDLSCKAGPKVWGNLVGVAFDRHEADAVIGEINFGGDMVRFVVQAARPRTPFIKVTASRGKAVRAEPFAPLYDQGKVRHVGVLSKLEDELIAFSTFGYTGQGSPNRADALIWALAALFPGIIAGPRKAQKKVADAGGQSLGWMS